MFTNKFMVTCLQIEDDELLIEEGRSPVGRVEVELLGRSILYSSVSNLAILLDAASEATLDEDDCSVAILVRGEI
jgi:hypothetical protein